MDRIRIDETDPDQPPVLVIATCQFGPDHDWIDITTLSDIEARFMCANCKAIGTTPLESMKGSF